MNVSSKNLKVTLKSTYLTAEMSTKVEESDYIYYMVDEGIRPPPESYHFEPSDDDVMFDKDSTNWQRLIFPECGEYNDYEEEKYEELQDYIEDQNVIIPSHIGKAAFMRFHQANHYKPKKTVEDLVNHLEWRKRTLPIYLTSEQKRFLAEGLFYIHGRDRCYRPLNVFDPKVIIGKDANRDEILMIVHFVLQYMIENMLVPGKIENWISVMDLANLSVNQLPKKWLTAFIKSCQSNYKCRGVKSFILNSSWGVRAIWRMAQAFVDVKVKQKIVFHNSTQNEELISMFHPSQLEKKFGGEAENLTVFWPPKAVSNEYGVDPDKIQKSSSSISDSSAE